MNKIYLIIVKPETDSLTLKERIKMIGSNYVFWKNHWLVSTSSSAKELYQKLSAEADTPVSMIITQIDTSNYYGRMNTTLWEWMRKQESTKK